MINFQNESVISSVVLMLDHGHMEEEASAMYTVASLHQHMFVRTKTCICQILGYKISTWQLTEGHSSAKELVNRLNCTPCLYYQTIMYCVYYSLNCRKKNMILQQKNISGTIPDYQIKPNCFRLSNRAQQTYFSIEHAGYKDAKVN